MAPARVVDGKQPTYAFERRMEIDPKSGTMETVYTVIIDAKQSVGNRDEDAIVTARRDESTPEGKALRQVPTVQVRYGEESWSDLTLPHRVFDGHIRAASQDGTPVTKLDAYRAIRNATKLNARALLDAAPTSLVWGAWDSTRKSHQGRYQTCLVGEVIGVLADQDRDPHSRPNKRAAARLDPVATSVKLDTRTVEELLQAQAEELSPNLQKKIRAEAKKKGAQGSSMSTLGLGNISPSLEGLGGVACRSITRRRVLSFAALRQLRFGGSAKSDTAARALLAAYGLLGMALSDRELYLRANCDLVEAGLPIVSLDQRFGNKKKLAPITVEVALRLFEDALAHAERHAGVEWRGQILEFEGNPKIVQAASNDDPEEN